MLYAAVYWWTGFTGNWMMESVMGEQDNSQGCMHMSYTITTRDPPP